MLPGRLRRPRSVAPSAAAEQRLLRRRKAGARGTEPPTGQRRRAERRGDLSIRAAHPARRSLRCRNAGSADRGTLFEPAIVLFADEKSQIQALDRTQPGLPLNKGRCGTMTHDYKRNGTATLFAALNTLDGTVISMCGDRHRHQEWLRFLRVIDEVTSSNKVLQPDPRQLCHA
jgi:hypothetical protein